MFITVTGGSGSGKSAFAEKCALLLAHGDAAPLPEDKSYGDITGKESGPALFLSAEAGKTAEEPRPGNPVYLATMNPAGRVERQRQLTGISREKILGRTVLVEDLSNLIANELFSGEDPDGGAWQGPGDPGDGAFLSEKTERTCREIREGIAFLRSQAGHLILVMNEIFSDGIRYDPQTDQFLRAAGLLSRDFVSLADLSYEVVFGIPLALKKEGEAARKLAERLRKV